jgi:fructose-1-phosphate kinase PfkB-like protein
MDSVVKLFGSLIRQLQLNTLPTAVDESSLNAITTVLSNAVESLLIDTPEHEELSQKLETVLDQTEDLPPKLVEALRAVFNS